MVNKWDLIEKDTKTAQSHEKTIRSKLSTIDYIPIVFTSVISKQRIYQVIEKTMEFTIIGLKSSTSPLIISFKGNRKLPPPAIKG